MRTPVPGWDCHGLPIETALLKELKVSSAIQDLPAFRQERVRGQVHRDAEDFKQGAGG